MTDPETLIHPGAQALRRRLLMAVAPYRLVSDKSVAAPSYVLAAFHDAVKALDRWTTETEKAGQVHA